MSAVRGDVVCQQAIIGYTHRENSYKKYNVSTVFQVPLSLRKLCDFSHYFYLEHRDKHWAYPKYWTWHWLKTPKTV